MHPSRRYYQLDVFSHQLLKGNPLAVIVDAQGLDAETMQSIARWTNLSETTFLLPTSTPEADYRVRIFTPRQELPFAGHPSVGSAWVAIEAGVVPAGKCALVQECAAGLLPISVDGEGASRVIHVQAPPASVDPINAVLREALVAALGVTLSAERTRMVDNGPRWIICDLGNGAQVRSLVPDMTALSQLCMDSSAVGVSVFGREHSGSAAMAVRAFCPADGIPEDPVTGSANAAIAALLDTLGDPDGYGLSYRASQGREVGRDGVVQVTRNSLSSTITIGGQCASGVQGVLLLGAFNRSK